MKNAIAELDGDEMTRVLWQLIKDKLILPFVDLKTEYYDLGLKNRDNTDDKVTYESAAAIKRLGVGVKCATITSNQARVEEYNLKQLTPSPNGIIRAELDGTVFREPIFVKNVHGTVSGWEKPIVLGRHAYGDIYKNTEIKTPCAGKAELVFTGEDGTEIRKTIQMMKGPGILQGIHNMDKSIESFARCCFTYALDRKISVWFGAKDTISKIYDGNFKAITDGATEVRLAKFDAASLQKAILTYALTKSDRYVLFQNPSVYADISDGTGNKDKILQEQISRREIEGVKIILAPQVPADVYGILADPANYGIGVADELKIVEKPIANSLVHQYDCSVYLCGSPIVAKDNIVLKAE